MKTQNIVVIAIENFRYQKSKGFTAGAVMLNRKSFIQIVLVMNICVIHVMINLI